MICGTKSEPQQYGSYPIEPQIHIRNGPFDQENVMQKKRGDRSKERTLPRRTLPPEPAGQHSLQEVDHFFGFDKSVD